MRKLFICTHTHTDSHTYHELLTVNSEAEIKNKQILEQKQETGGSSSSSSGGSTAAAIIKANGDNGWLRASGRVCESRSNAYPYTFMNHLFDIIRIFIFY